MHARCRALGLPLGLSLGLPLRAQPLAAGAALLLSGCTADAAHMPDWLAALALLLVGALAYALGALRERHKAQQALRAARAEARALQELRTAWWWQSDAQHQIVCWQAPAGQSDSLDSALVQDSGLDAALRSGQPFAGLRVHTAHPVAGARSWELRGLPRQDELGAFAGYSGVAQALDGEHTLGKLSALPALLATCHGAAVLVLQGSDGLWQVHLGNSAARALWPQLDWPMPLEAVASRLPAPAAAALRKAITPGGVSAIAAGWQIERFDTPAQGSAMAHGQANATGQTLCGLVLAQQGVAAGTAGGSSDESDNFTFTASHDLRAPIRVVEGFTRIVKEDYGHLLDRVGNDHLDRVLGAAARMNLMIDALLTLARLSSQPLARQPVNLSQLSGYIVDELRRSQPDREADIEIQPELATTGDPTLLRLVLENLLSNAWKYTARTERAQISLRTVPHENGMAYVVRDNGAGFDMRSADRLFGLFQRLHSASEFAGHGVGLASVRRIVHRHGGEIWAEAEPGRGAAFYFTLAG